MSETEDCDTCYEDSYVEYQRKQISEDVGEW